MTGVQAPQDEFLKELTELINKHSKENVSDTPDFVLAEYLSTCLYAYNNTVMHREHLKSLSD